MKLSFEVVAAGIGLILATLTLLVPAWIEFVSGIDPDNFDGSVEWLIVAVSLAMSIVASIMAWREWRRILPTRQHPVKECTTEID